MKMKTSQESNRQAKSSFYVRITSFDILRVNEEMEKAKPWPLIRIKFNPFRAMYRNGRKVACL
jgi:hypothetical protein